VLASLGGPDCLVVSDELNHASIIDGCRLSRSTVAVASHNDVEHVEALLSASTAVRAMVVSDAVFSMDGDEAPVLELAQCCARHGALLVLDEAHAVLGPSFAEVSAVPDLELLHVLTLSKTLGSMGGAVTGSRSLVDLLVNRARPFIFTTGLSPADAAAARAALAVVRSPEGRVLRDRLRAHTERLISGHPSPIVPVIVGTEHDAVAASEALLQQGLLVPAIRPPTVAPGTSRLRIALSAAHTDEMVDHLLGVLSELELEPTPLAAKRR
jgi:8-amino-7-oxononanoate synthase